MRVRPIMDEPETCEGADALREHPDVKEAKGAIAVAKEDSV
jgi:hypothetical protein